MSELPLDDPPGVAEARELLEDLADAAVARQALQEPGEDIPAEQVWADLGLS